MATEREFSEHFEAIRKDIAALTDTVGQLVSDTAGIQASLKKRLSALGSDAYQAAAKQAGTAVSSMETEIAKKPLIAVITALSLGFAIGLISRK
jgi:ElaB/YqjD/DUF883 family membrane-anchored ribosome-binding protein